MWPKLLWPQWLLLVPSSWPGQRTRIFPYTYGISFITCFHNALLCHHSKTPLFLLLTSTALLATVLQWHPSHLIPSSSQSPTFFETSSEECGNEWCRVGWKVPLTHGMMCPVWRTNRITSPWLTSRLTATSRSPTHNCCRGELLGLWPLFGKGRIMSPSCSD